MNCRLLILTFLLPAAFIQAQNAMKGPTKLDVSITGATNITVIPVDLTTEKEGSSPRSSLSIDSDEGEIEPAQPSSSFTLIKEDSAEAQASVEKTPLEGGGTNDVLDAKTSFLMDMGVKYTDEGDYAEAEQAYLRALNKNPDNPSIRFSLSTLYLQTARYEEAAAILTRMKDEYPYHPVILNNLAWIYASSKTLKNSKKALLHAREAILSKPTDPSLWDTLAEAYYISGEYEKSLRSSNHALDLLQQLRASKEQIQPFVDRRTKIQRADEAFKRLTGADKEEK